MRFVSSLFILLLIPAFASAEEIIQREISWTFQKNNEPSVQVTNKTDSPHTLRLRLLFGGDSYRYPVDLTLPPHENRVLHVREIFNEVASHYPNLNGRTSGTLQLEYEGTNDDLVTKLVNRRAARSANRRTNIPTPKPAPEIRNPVLIEVQPDSGSVHGGYKVNIKGRNFQQGTTVQWNGNPVPAQFVNPETMLLTTPAGQSGAVRIEVINPDHTNFISADAFRYKGLPRISSVVPATGSPAGGFSVTVYGSNFEPGCSVLFGNRYGETTFVNPNALAALVPPGESGTTNVSVTSKEGDRDTLPGAFLYNEPPRIVSIQALPNPIVRNTTTTITVKAEDSEADELNYEYRVAQGPAGGMISGQGDQAIYRSPNTIGQAIIQVTVYDQHGAKAQRTIEVDVE